MDYAALTKLIEDQENTLRFDRFTHEDALKLGLLMVEKMKNLPKPMTIELYRNNLLVFRYANEGAIRNYDRWLARKRKTVETMYMSSLRAYAQFNRDGKDIAKDVFWDPMEFALCGGGFPIFVNECGMIGTVLVSGQPHLVDHQFIVECLSEYLGKTTRGTVLDFA
ncbi:MAG: heme-binding protein [Clostridiales bacterium]|nr:heme-binding protein [Clostridiales bacterium]